MKHFNEIGIIFVGNRAVVTFRSYGNEPRGHKEVFYGPFFGWRLGRAVKKVWRQHKKDLRPDEKI